MDREDEVDPEVEEALKAKTALSVLLKSEGWAILSKWLEVQKTTRVNNVMYTPRGAAEDEWKQEFMKGEAAAFELILQAPKLLIEDADITLEN